MRETQNKESTHIKIPTLKIAVSAQFRFVNIFKRTGMKINSEKVAQSCLLLSSALKVIHCYFFSSPNKYQNRLIRESDLVSLQLMTSNHHPLRLQKNRGWIPWTEYFKTSSGVKHNLTIAGNCTQKCLMVHVAYTVMLCISCPTNSPANRQRGHIHAHLGSASYQEEAVSTVKLSETVCRARGSSVMCMEENGKIKLRSQNTVYPVYF